MQIACKFVFESGHRWSRSRSWSKAFEGAYGSAQDLMALCCQCACVPGMYALQSGNSSLSLLYRDFRPPLPGKHIIADLVVGVYLEL